MFNVFICSSYQRGMRPILHHIDISSTLQRTEVIFMENIQSAKVTNPTIIRQRDLPYVVKIKYSCAIFKSHENNAWLPRREKKISKCGSSNSPRLSIKKKQRKTKPTHPCSPRQVLLSRSTSPPWLDPRQTSWTVVPLQLFLTGGQKRGCRLQRQRWCQQQGGGRRQRQ